MRSALGEHKMTSAKLSSEQPKPQKWGEIAPYALLSLCGFLCGFGVLVLMLWKVERLVALGLTGKLYYLVLLPMGLSAAAFLFGALRSYGHYRGKQVGGALELGGPVVGFVIVLILGFWLPEPASNFPLTVYVHGAGGPQDLALRGLGSVVIDTAGLRRRAPIGSDGEAFFPEIPANFRGQEVPVAIDARDYELIDPNQKVRLIGSTAYVEARKKAGRVMGYVHDDKGKPLAGVSIVVAGLMTSTDGAGHFDLVIPGNQLQPSLTLEAIASGFALWSDTIVPNSNDVVITLHR